MNRVFALLLVCGCAILPSCAGRQSGPVVHHGYANGAVAAAWSPGGSRLALANSRRIRVYDGQTLAAQRELPGGTKTASGPEFEQRFGLGNSLVFLAEDRLATTGLGAMVSIWDADAGARVESFDWPEEQGYPVSLGWSGAARMLAAGTDAGWVILMRPGSGAAPEALGEAGGLVQAVRFSASGDYLGAAGTGGELVIWNLALRGDAARIPVTGTVMDIEPMDQAGRYLVAGDNLEIWSFTSPVAGDTLANPDLGGQAAGYALTTLSLAALAVATAITPVDALIVGAPVPPRETVMSCSRAVAVHPTRTLIADMHPGYVKESIRILDTDRNEVVEHLNPRGAGTCDLEFSPDGRWLLVANQRGGHLYDTRTWAVTRLD